MTRQKRKKARDVVIIGAGATGCAIASHLLRLDRAIDVVLLDRHHIGAGSTSRSTAAFRHQWSVPAHVAFSRYAAKEFDRLADLGRPILFRQNGYLFLFTDREAFDQAARRVERQRRLGVEGVEVLHPKQLGRVPCGGDIDAKGLVGATWGPEDGFLDPLAVAQAYLDESHDLGIDYRPESEVTGLLRDGADGPVLGVRLGEHTLHASTVVNAAGVWSGSIAALAGLDLPIRPAKRYLYHTRPMGALDVSEWPLLIGDRGAHLRPSEQNSLMMAWERRPGPIGASTPADRLWEAQDTIDPGFGPGPDDYGVTILSELARHVPALADRVGIAHVTCGWYAVTPDHKAILGGDPRLPGLYHAAGFSGHGIMHAPASGRMIAELILGRQSILGPNAELEQTFALAPLLEGRPRPPVEDMVL